MLEQVDYLGFNCPDMLQFDTEDGYLKSDWDRTKDFYGQ